MAEGIAVSNYGTDLSGTLANRPTKAPAGVLYYATDTREAFISLGGGSWIPLPPAVSGTITIASADVLALNATPQELVAAPGANKALIFDGAVIHKPAGTAYTLGTNAGLAVKYTNGSGLAVGQVDETGFLNQATAQTRWIHPYQAASGDSQITPVANAALVLHALTAEVTAGDSDLLLQVHYRIIPTVLS